MLKPLLIIVALVAVTPPTFAQGGSYAYGQTSDLKGLKKVFIDTGADIKSRDQIIKELDKAKLGVEIVDEQSEAEIILGFGGSKVLHSVITSRNENVTTGRAIMDDSGTGVVIAIARGRERIISSFSDTQTTWFERKPVTNFAREFIKLYKKANDLK